MSELKLKYRPYAPTIIARDPDRGVVLLGGLGVFEVGRMWADERPDHAKYPGYEDAEIVDTEGAPLFGITLPSELP